MSDNDPLFKAMSEAVESAASQHGVVPIKHLLLVEGLDPADNDHTLWVVASENLAAWDALGMLTWAISAHQAKVEDDE